MRSAKYLPLLARTLSLKAKNSILPTTIGLFLSKMSIQPLKTNTTGLNWIKPLLILHGMKHWPHFVHVGVPYGNRTRIAAATERSFTIKLKAPSHARRCDDLF